MAVDSVADRCSACAADLKSTDKVLKCGVFCNLAFHSSCKNISDQDFQSLNQVKSIVTYI